MTKPPPPSSPFLSRFIVPIATAGGVAAAGALAHTVIAVQHIERTRFTREMGSEIRREITDRAELEASARASIREQLVELKAQHAQLRRDLDELRAEFRDHERSRTAHRD